MTYGVVSNDDLKEEVDMVMSADNIVVGITASFRVLGITASYRVAENFVVGINSSYRAA